MIGGIVGDVSGGYGDTWDIADVSKSMGGKLELISAGQTEQLIVSYQSERISWQIHLNYSEVN